MTLALARRDRHAGLAAEVAHLLHASLGGEVRAWWGGAASAAGREAIDVVTWSPEPLACASAPELADLRWTAPEPEDELASERALGAILASVVVKLGSELPERRLRAARERRLAALDPATRSARLEAFLKGFTAGPPSAVAERARIEDSGEPLAAALEVGSSAVGLGDPQRFWSAVGLAVRAGRDRKLLPDPILAVGATPPLSAPLAAIAAGRVEIDPRRCTGCGACWTACPHGAIEARALAPATLLEAALARTGSTAEPLRRFAGKLAARFAIELDAEQGGHADERLLAAGGAVLADAKLAGERLTLARGALAAVATTLGGMPMLPFQGVHDLAERLVLAVDPDRCTDCGLCLPLCEPEAATRVERDGEALANARRVARAVTRLPASPEAALERLRQPIGSLAAALLDPAATRPLAGFDSASAGSGSRLAVRQALAVAARHLASRRDEIRGRVSELRNRLAAEVRAELAGALPDRDLGALAEGLERLERPAVDLAELGERLGGAVNAERVDVARLRHLVDAARAVHDLAAQLEGAPEQPARAPFAIVVGPGPALGWARRFPDNPFAVPAAVAGEAPLALARGLALAEADRAVAECRALRRAALELDRPAEAAAQGELEWKDLDAAERSLATPLIVLVDERRQEPEFVDALEILAGDLPVAILGLTPPPRDGVSAWSALAWAAPGGWVAHATIAAADPLDEVWSGFAAASRGALVRCLAPDASLDGIGREEIWKVARGAVEARVFPLGCRDAAAHATATAPRVDPLAEADERERLHAAELAELTSRHREELGQLAEETRRELAERARARLLELAARHREDRGVEEQRAS